MGPQKTIIIPKEKAVFRMDGNGIWHNEHGRFEHPKIISHFNRSIKKDDQGYFLSQMIDEHREEKVYFPYEETAVFAVDLKLRTDDTIDLMLNTAQTLRLDPQKLFIKNDRLFMRTPDHLIKFNQQALTKIARFLDETDQGMVLTLGNCTTPFLNNKHWMPAMMTIYRYSFRIFLTLRFYFHWLTRTGGFGQGQAIRFTPGPVDKKGPSLRAGLFRHHVKQFHESSCSVASVVNVINTLRERGFGPKGPPVTQKEILDRVRAAHWKERMSSKGHKGKRGLPLDVLGEVVRAGLEAYAIPHARVEIIQAKGGRQAEPSKEKLLACLRAFHTLDNCLIIAHFDQGSFVKEMNIPHISPVGGFDPDTGQVTILDVDPTQPEPYKLPFYRFYRGISTRYGGFFLPFGYGRGGVVVIHLNPPKVSLN